MSDSKATDPAAKLKSFRPRAGVVRKSKAERDAHAKEEAEKAAARAAAAVQAAGKPSQTSKHSSAKKKEVHRDSRDNRDSSQGAGRGVFGAGTGVRPGWKKTIADAGRSEMLEGQEGAKSNDAPMLQGQDGEVGGNKAKGSSGGVSGSARTTRAVQPDARIESDDEPDERRRDIERIWISSDEEEVIDDLYTGKGKSRAVSEGKRIRLGGGLRPVRAPRTTAEDRVGEAEKKTDKRIVKSSRMVVDDGDGHEEGDEMEIDAEPPTDQLQTKHDIPSSPEISKRGKPGRKLGSRAKDSKLTTETVEEKAERLRLIDDVEKLKAEFLTTTRIKKDADGVHDEGYTRPDGKLFLFQFPPLVPFLVDECVLSATNADGKPPASELGPSIKHENEGADSVQLSAGGERSHGETMLPKTQSEGMFTAIEPLRLPAGRVGQLHVHKSGKVTMDWGGTDMEVRYGTEVDFLQDVVLVETPSENDEGIDKASSSQIGATYALGQVQKKMIVIPDWQKLYD